MERVFIDIGAHTGSSAKEALDPKYGFSRVISVEPDLQMVEHLEKVFAQSVSEKLYQVAPYGLSNTCREAVLYGDNSGGGASLFNKISRINPKISRTIILKSWHEFEKDYGLQNSKIYIKLNCEGAEVEIIEGIISSGVKNIASIVIDFDIIKVPLGAWKKWRSIRKLERAKINYLLYERIFVKKSSRNSFENWLFSLPEIKSPPIKPVPINKHQFIRIKWLEFCSALGIPEIRLLHKKGRHK